MDHKYNICLSEAAITEIKKQLVQRETPNSSFRIGLKSGGCSGFAYHIQFEDDKPKEKDFVFNFNGLQVIVDKKSIIYLNGSELDWESSLMRKGFKFKNPNEKSSCGCGNSFSTE